MLFCCWQTGYVTLIESYDLSWHQLNSKNNGLFLLSKTIFRLWNCFLSSVATGGKDGHGLKLGEVGPTFSSFNHAMPAIKLKTKILLWLVLPDNFVWYMFSAGKWREIRCHLSRRKGPKGLTDESYGFIKLRKRCHICVFVIDVFKVVKRDAKF